MRNKNNKWILMFLIIIVIFLIFLSLQKKQEIKKQAVDVVYAGIRSTTASGIQSESSNYLAGATNFVASKFTGSTPSVIYGPGYITDNGIAYLNFPSPGGSYSYIEFASTDENEAHLDAFDAMGAKVWLQVESGRANMLTLIDLVLNQYKHHPSVIGFGVDVEWLEHPTYPEGRKVTDAEATSWVNRIKSHNPNYKLFLKHWETSMMPNNYPVGDVVFISDSEQNGNFNNFLNGFIEWGNTFPDSEVGFQVGYPSDKGWWDDYADPIDKLGTELFNAIPNMKYYYWVDFSILDVFPRGSNSCSGETCGNGYCSAFCGETSLCYDCGGECAPESNSAFCSRLGKTCGDVTANDNCGTSRTVNCGTCSIGYTCSNGACVQSCSCTSWVDGNCGVGGCSATQRQQTRTCTPTNCLSQSRCVSDASCTLVTCPTTICNDGIISYSESLSIISKWTGG